MPNPNPFTNLGLFGQGQQTPDQRAQALANAQADPNSLVPKAGATSWQGLPLSQLPPQGPAGPPAAPMGAMPTGSPGMPGPAAPGGPPPSMSGIQGLAPGLAGAAPNISSLGALSAATGGQMGGLSAPSLPPPGADSGITDAPMSLPQSSGERMAPQNYINSSLTPGPSGMQKFGAALGQVGKGASAAGGGQPQFGPPPAMPSIQMPQAQVVTGNQNSGAGWQALMQQMMGSRRK